MLAIFVLGRLGRDFVHKIVRAIFQKLADHEPKASDLPILSAVTRG